MSGGARAAHQVGLLRRLAHRYPDLRPHFITGVSAGAINSVCLAVHPGGFAAATMFSAFSAATMLA